jgi:hypothetical protein
LSAIEDIPISIAVRIEIVAIAIGAVRIIFKSILKWLSEPHHEWFPLARLIIFVSPSCLSAVALAKADPTSRRPLTLARGVGGPKMMPEEPRNKNNRAWKLKDDEKYL